MAPVGKKILYVGEDQRYWKSLKSEIKQEYGAISKLLFSDIHDDGPEGYKLTFKKIIDAWPDIIYIDFNYNHQSQLHLASLLRSIHLTKCFTIVGLFGHNAQESDFRESLECGVLINQVKSVDDLHDTIYDAFAIAFPNEVKKSPFYQARFNPGRKFQLKEDFKINYLTPKYLSVESNYELQKGMELDLETNIPENVMPSKQYLVKEIFEGQHNYNMLYKGNLEFYYVDKIKEPPKLDPVEKAIIDGEKEKRKKLVKEVEEKVDAWVSEIKDSPLPKNIRIQIIDRKFQVVGQAESWLEDYPYLINLQAHMDDPDKDLNHFRPNIIAFVFEPIPTPPAEYNEDNPDDNDNKEKKVEKKINPEDYNNIQSVEKILKTIEDIPKYDPIIIIFNNKEGSSKGYQSKFKYKKILVNGLDFSFDVIMSAASMFESKNKFFNPSTMGNEKRIHLVKNDPLSRAVFLQEIDLLNISESSLFFHSKRQYDNYTVLSLDAPAKCYITLVPHEEVSEYPKYQCFRGLIHSVTLEEKEKLRKYIIAESKKAEEAEKQKKAK